MENAERTETREFGTGLRDYLEHHGVRLNARVMPPSNLDLFALSALVAHPLVELPEPVLLTLRPASLAA